MIVATGTSGGAETPRVGRCGAVTIRGCRKLAAAPQPPIGKRRNAGAASQGSQTGDRRTGTSRGEEV